MGQHEEGVHGPNARNNMNNGLHSKLAVYDHNFYYWKPHWSYKTVDGSDHYYGFWLEFPGVGDTIKSRVAKNGLFDREQAIHHVNEVRRSNAQGAGFADRAIFVPTHVIVFPYGSGWEQGTAILATSNADSIWLTKPHPFEITMKGVPRRQMWKPKANEFPMYHRKTEF